MVALAFLLAAGGELAGAKVCGSCHPGQAKTQAQSAHARALARSAPPDPVRAEWRFGAGSQAQTFVSQVDEDHYLEHSLSWYRRIQGLAATPGHRGEEGVRYRTFAPDAAILRCFGCHSTGGVRLAAGRAVEPAEPGVRCEACHGPGAAHAAKPDKDSIVSPKRMTAEAINELCGRCHRMPPAAGEDTNWSNPWNVRHQPVYLSQSACFQKSGGKLSCVSCHDPHADRAARGDAECAECHAKVRHRTAVAGGSCVGCHMPVVALSPLLRFANHWIGVYQLTGAGADRLRPRR